MPGGGKVYHKDKHKHKHKNNDSQTPPVPQTSMPGELILWLVKNIITFLESKGFARLAATSQRCLSCSSSMATIASSPARFFTGKATKSAQSIYSARILAYHCSKFTIWIRWNRSITRISYVVLLFFVGVSSCCMSRASCHFKSSLQC